MFAVREHGAPREDLDDLPGQREHALLLRRGEELDRGGAFRVGHKDAIQGGGVVVGPEEAVRGDQLDADRLVFGGRVAECAGGVAEIVRRYDGGETDREAGGGPELVVVGVERVAAGDQSADEAVAERNAAICGAAW